MEIGGGDFSYMFLSIFFFFFACVKDRSGLGCQRSADWTSCPLTEVKEERMKEKSDSPSISLGMFICSSNQKREKTVYKMECQEHCVKEHLSGRL